MKMTSVKCAMKKIRFRRFGGWWRAVRVPGNGRSKCLRCDGDRLDEYCLGLLCNHEAQPTPPYYMMAPVIFKRMEVRRGKIRAGG
jgi:hypothetical protein